MRRLVQLAARLYPAEWRRRYAHEFDALLEDVTPGWRELFDVVMGAFTMRIRTRGAVPVVCAIVGAIAGGIVAMRTPDVFASSATIRVSAGNVEPTESAAEGLRATLEKALASSSNDTKHATTVSLLRGGAATTLKLTYQDRDPARAKRVAEELTAAIAAGTSGPSSTEVLDAPSLPVSPIRPDYSLTVASGGVIGFAAGYVLLWFGRSRLRWFSTVC